MGLPLETNQKLQLVQMQVSTCWQVRPAAAITHWLSIELQILFKVVAAREDTCEITFSRKIYYLFSMFIPVGDAKCSPYRRDDISV